MEKLIDAINNMIDTTNKTEYILKEKMNFLNNFSGGMHVILNSDLYEIIKFYIYVVYFDCDEYIERLNYIESELRNYDFTPEFLSIFSDIIKKKINININNDSKEEIEKLHLTDNSKKLLDSMFKQYNSKKSMYFLSLIKDEFKDIFSLFIAEMVSVKHSLLLANCVKTNKPNIGTRDIEKVLKENLKVTFQLMEAFNKFKDSTNKDYKIFNREKNKTLMQLNEIKELLIQNKTVDYVKYQDILMPNMMLNLIFYNSLIINDEYKNVKIKTQQLSSYDMDNVDFYIKTNHFNILPEKIDNVDSLNILKFINEKLSFLKEYSNVLYYILTYSNIEVLKKIYTLIDGNIISKTFLLNNYEKIFNEYILNNVLMNISLFDKLNINIKSVSNYNDILFIDNKIMKDRINIYKRYNINLSLLNKNLDILLHDNSYIIDMFIEIGMYNFIKDNPDYINSLSINIIKRINLSKELGNIFLNDDNKLKGTITKEDKCIIDNNELNQVIVFNYKDYNNQDLIECMNKQNVNQDIIVIPELKTYEINNYEYKIGDMIISKNKVIRNINNIYNSDLINNFTREEIIFNSIIYNYPNYLTNDNINKLKDILGIKRKLKESNL